MPLDSSLKTLLDALQSQPTPPMWQMDPAMARIAFGALMQAVGPRDEPIGSTKDVAISNGRVRLRVYTPLKAPRGDLPALLFFHGGGYVIGDLETHDGLCRILANEAGACVIAVDYRLAPEHKFPAAVDDGLAALRYVQDHAADLGIDPDRLAVGGDSAGGGLAAVLAQAAAQQGWRLQMQMLLFPVTQIGQDTPSLTAFAEGYFLEREGLRWFYAHYLPDNVDRDDPRISPLKAKDVRGLAPAFVMLAGFDPLHDEGLHYADRLRQAGVPVTLRDYPDMVHDFIYMVSALPAARTALSDAAAALKTALSRE
ncbi:MAG: alpha/beta hydrolase [Rhizomicrobium sp.]